VLLQDSSLIKLENVSWEQISKINLNFYGITFQHHLIITDVRVSDNKNTLAYNVQVSIVVLK
jgi:hypothetical protein